MRILTGRGEFDILLWGHAGLGKNHFTEFSLSLLVYLVVVILVTVLFYTIRRTIWGSLMCGLIIGFLVLIGLTPSMHIDPQSTSTESNSAIYLMIMLLTPIVIVLYAFVSASKDKR